MVTPGRLSAAAALLCLAPVASHAQTDPSSTGSSEEMILFEDLPSVFGASKYDQKSSEAPASVSVVTRDEIEGHGYRTLADILRSVPGLFVTYDRNYHYIGARGFGRPGDYNSRVLLLVDGHRVNDNIYGSALTGSATPIDVDVIERVEIIRGPTSSLYGTNAFFAVINVITRRGRDLKGAELSGEAASFQAGKGSVAYGTRFGGGPEVLLAASHYDARGQRLFFREFDDPSTNHGWAEEVDGDRHTKAFLRASWADYELSGAFSSRRKHIPTASFSTVFNEPGTRTDDQQSFVTLKYQRELHDDSRLRLVGSYDSSRYDGRYVYSGNVLRDYGYGRWLSLDAQYDRPLGEVHKLIFGGEYRYNLQQDQGAHDEDPPLTYLRDRRRSAIWAVYVQDEFRLSPNLTLSAGIRHDHHDTFGGTTNPRVGLIYGARSRTTWKLLYGTAFRAPTAYENYYDDGGYSQKANPDLRPETIKTYEVVLEKSLADRLRSTASLYHYRIHGLVSLRTDPSDGLLLFENSEDITAGGIELALEGRFSRGLDGRLSYAFQETKDTESDEILTNSPRSIAKANVTADLWEGRFAAGVEVQYLGRRRTLTGDSAGDHVVSNLTIVSRPWRRGPELSASAYNLLDEMYGDPAGEEHVQRLIPQDGRTYSLRIRYRF